MQNLIKASISSTRRFPLVFIIFVLHLWSGEVWGSTSKTYSQQRFSKCPPKRPVERSTSTLSDLFWENESERELLQRKRNQISFTNKFRTKSCLSLQLIGEPLTGWRRKKGFFELSCWCWNIWTLIYRQSLGFVQVRLSHNELKPLNCWKKSENSKI